MKPINTNRVCKSLLLAFLMLFVPTLTIAVNAVSYRSNLGSKTDPTRSEGSVLKGPEDVIFVAPEGTVSTYYMGLCQKSLRNGRRKSEDLASFGVYF